MSASHVRPPEGPSGEGGSVSYLDQRRSKQSVPSLSGGDGGGTSDDMLQRVESLEKNFLKIDGKLDTILASLTAGHLANEKRFGAIEGRLTGIEAKLDTKSSSEAVARVGADLAQRVIVVEKDLGAKASAVDMAGVKAAVEKLPTTIVLIGFAVSIFVAAGLMKHFFP